MSVRYVMSGMFCGTDKSYYEIMIPSPHVYDTEEEAVVKDSILGYRFVRLSCEKEPMLVIFDKEEFRAGGYGSILAHVTGNLVASYTYEQFTQHGGKIRMLKPGHDTACMCDDDFMDTDKTFAEIFADAVPDKFYYVDSEAYVTETV